MYQCNNSCDNLYRFEGFEVDARTGELHHLGVRIPLQDVPFRFLVALLEQPGALRTRDELREAIWPQDVHLDFDGALATAARKVRQALGDTPHDPHYIETLPGRGFRFLGTLEMAPAPPDPAPAPVPRIAWHSPLLMSSASLILILFVLTLGTARPWSHPKSASLPSFSRLTAGSAEIRSARFLQGGREAVVGASWEGSTCNIQRIGLEDLSRRPLGLEGHPLAIGPEGRWAVALNALRTSHSMGNFACTLGVGLLADSQPKAAFTEVLHADFSPEGTMALIRYTSGRYHLECPPGEVRLDQAAMMACVRFSPDGRTLAYIQHLGPFGGDPGRVMLLDLRSGATRPLSRLYPFIRGLAWSSGEIWFTAGTPTQTDVQAVDARGRERTVYRGTARFHLHDTSRQGQVLLAQSMVHPQALLWRQDGTSPATFDREGHFYMTDLSPDGWQIVGQHIDSQGHCHLVSFTADGSPPLLLGEGNWSGAALSLDRRWIAAGQNGLQPELHILPVGLGKPVTIPLPGLQSVGVCAWTPDGRAVLLAAHALGRPPQIFEYTLASGTLRPLTPEGANLTSAPLRIAPDGQRFVVETEEGWAMADRNNRPLAPILGLDRDDQVAGWSADGHQLFIAKAGPPPLRLWILDLRTRRRWPWRTLQADKHSDAHLSFVMVTPDRRTITAQSYRNPGTLYLVSGLK